MTKSTILNLTPEVRSVLENLLTIAGQLEDNARVVDHLTDEPYGDLAEFQRSVYEPLRDKRSVTSGHGENFSLDFEDVGPVFDVIKGISEGWVGGTPWKAMSSAERSAVDRFLEAIRRPRD
jgi:hypothetical protein